MKKVAIVQSNYVPWKGYFDLIGMVDEFVLLDEVQFTRRDWRNRNKIKTPQGLTWLTIPVVSKGKYEQKISETRISDPGWCEKHWRTLQQNYRKAAGYEEVADTIYAYKYEDFDFVKIAEENFKTELVVSKEDIYLFKRNRLGIENILGTIN